MYPNHLEETEVWEDGETHFVFDVYVNGWYLCVEGEWETPPEDWFISGAGIEKKPDEDALAKLFSSIITDALDNAFNYDEYTLGEEMAELVLAQPVHEWKDHT